MAMSKSGDMLVSGSHDRAARIWNRTEEHIYLVNTKYANTHVINVYIFVPTYCIQHRNDNRYDALSRPRCPRLEAP